MRNSFMEVVDIDHRGTQTEEPLVPGLTKVPWRVREIAMLRGLGYSYREIAQELNVTPQAVFVMLVRNRRPVKSLRQQMDLVGLSSRAVNVLARHGIRNREQALTQPTLDLIKSERNCGSKTIDEICRWLYGEPDPLSQTEAAD